MILYHPDLCVYFNQLGVDILIQDDRSFKVYKYLVDKFGEEILCRHDKGFVPLSKEDLLLAHNLEYVEAFLNGNSNIFEDCFEIGDLKNINFKQIINKVLIQAYASYLSMKKALTDDFCYFLGGGMHHAMSSSGRGFCLINDIVIGIRKLQKEGVVKSAWVIDVDAHKGDGTAELTFTDDSISTLSIHMASGWPFDQDLDPLQKTTDNKEKPPYHIPSTIDIPIEEGKEKSYLLNLKEGLSTLDKKSKTRPDLAVIVDGADPYIDDELPGSGLIKLSLEELLERDQLIYNWLMEKKIPQSYLMAGGYGEKSWQVYAQFLESVYRVRSGEDK